MDSNGNRQSQDGRNGDGVDAAVTARIRRAIEAVSHGSGSRVELEAAAKELVSRLREQNERPEQMLLTIKRLLADAGLRPTYSATNDAAIRPESAGSVYRDVIAWSIRHYYADGNGNGDGDGRGDGPGARRRS